MRSKPRVLFLSQCLPFPPHSGVKNRTYNILRQLQREFEITLLPFFRRHHQPTARERAESQRALEGVVSAVFPALPIPAEHLLPRRALDHLRSVITRRPYTFFEYRSGEFRRRLRSVLERARPDLVHMDSLDLHGYLDECTGIPVACTHHNIESQLLFRRAARTRPPLLGAYIRHQAFLVERLERTLPRAFDLNVTVSTADALELQRLSPGVRTIVAPNGVDTGYFRPAPALAMPDRIVFLGPTYLLANRDAVEFFLAEIWPRIRRRRRRAGLCLIGGHPSPEHDRFSAHPGVTPVGQVPDIRPHMARAGCAVVPLRVGGGTRLKILDSWAMGHAVVSTRIGCEGLDARDGENILVRDDPQAFADAVVQVLADPALRRRLGDSGRETVERLYSWEIVGHDLRRAYRRRLAGEKVEQPAVLAS